MSTNEELTGLHTLLNALESGEMQIRERKKDVTKREIGKLKSEIEHLEEVLTRLLGVPPAV